MHACVLSFLALAKLTSQRDVSADQKTNKAVKPTLREQGIGFWAKFILAMPM
jgi:hypothetical protein